MNLTASDILQYGGPWLAAIGSILAVVAAIWGERIRSSLFKPTLQIELVDRFGQLTTETIFSTEWEQQGNQLSPQTRTRPARYYVLSVTNTRRWPVANNVQIMITGLEKPDPSGRPQIEWQGEVPLQWEHPQLYPTSRTVGPTARADFLVVAFDAAVQQNQRQQLHLMPAITPNNFQRSYYKNTRLWVTVIARSNETDSRQLRLEIAWDGEWNLGDTEMGRHLKIDVTATPSSSGAKPRRSWWRWIGA